MEVGEIEWGALGELLSVEGERRPRQELLAVGGELELREAVSGVQRAACPSEDDARVAQKWRRDAAGLGGGHLRGVHHDKAAAARPRPPAPRRGVCWIDEGVGDCDGGAAAIAPRRRRKRAERWRRVRAKDDPRTRVVIGIRRDVEHIRDGGLERAGRVAAELRLAGVHIGGRDSLVAPAGAHAVEAAAGRTAAARERSDDAHERAALDGAAERAHLVDTGDGVVGEVGAAHGGLLAVERYP